MRHFPGRVAEVRDPTGGQCMARTTTPITSATRFIVFFSICLIVAALYFSQEVLIPIALAVLVSFLLTPIVGWVERLKLGRTAAVLIAVLSLLGVFAVIGWVVKLQLTSISAELPRLETGVQRKLAILRRSANPLERSFHEFEKVTATSQPTTAPASIEHAVGEPTAELTGAPGTPIPVKIVGSSSVVEDAFGTLNKVAGPLSTTFLVVVLVIFMLISREELRDRMIRLTGDGRLHVTTQALDEAATRISRYLFAEAVVNFSYGCLVAGGLKLIGHIWGSAEGGFPSVLLWGLLCGLLRFVPYIGIWIAAAFPVVVSFAFFSGNGVFIGTIVLFAALEVIVSQFIEPYWYGSSTGMSPLAVLVSAVFWTWLWGPVGLVLSTPLTVCLVVMGKHVPALQFLDILLGDEPVLDPPTRLYQRMISMDGEEATDLARDYFKDHTLEDTYEQVILPALAMAAQDHHRGDIDTEHLQFVHQTIREMVDELGEAAQSRTAEQRKALAEKSKDENAIPAVIDRKRTMVPKGCVINVLCLPAKDEADEISGMMMAQLLQQHGYCAFAASVEALAAEMVEMVTQKEADVVCVSAMPPAAIAHSRYLCKRLSARFADLPTIVGLWTLQGDRDKARVRIACTDTVHLCVKFSEAIDQIEQFAHPFIVAAAQNANPPPAPVSTAGAT